MRRFPIPSLLALALASTSCKTPEPQQILDLSGLETYWAVDSAVGDRQYIAPVARFTLKNKSAEPTASIQATARFSRKGEEEKDWGTDWKQVTPARKPLLPGQTALVVLKSDGRYYSTGAPESFFEHKLFKDARVEVFVRVGSSPWVKFATADVERRIGTKTLESPAPAR